MSSLPERIRYDYAVLRVVPRVERGEFMNVGVIVWCPQARHLALDYECDRARLLALDPDLDLPMLEAALAALKQQCIAPGPAAARTPRQTFDFLVATKSAVLQGSPVHSGLTADAQGLVDELMSRFVRRPARSGACGAEG